MILTIIVPRIFCQVVPVVVLTHKSRNSFCNWVIVNCKVSGSDNEDWDSDNENGYNTMTEKASVEEGEKNESPDQDRYCSCV